MSEKLGDYSGEVTEGVADGVKSLEEMANQFDPQKAEAERMSVEPKILSEGEASKLTEDEHGNPKLESEYMDAWSRYENSENYNKNDEEFNQAIRNIGIGAALIDTNKDIVNQLENNNTDFYSAMERDTKVLNVFNKTFEDIAKIANNKNEAAARETIDYIKNTGKVGRFLVDKYKDWVDSKAS